MVYPPFFMSYKKTKEIFEKATTTNRGRFDINNHDFHLIPRIDMGKNLSLFKIFLKLETLYEDINFKRNAVIVRWRKYCVKEI